VSAPGRRLAEQPAGELEAGHQDLVTAGRRGLERRRVDPPPLAQRRNLIVVRPYPP
jgi:hypothetical protein